MSRVDALLDHAIEMRNTAGEFVKAGAMEIAGPMIALATLEATIALALVQRSRAVHMRRQPSLTDVPAMLGKALGVVAAPTELAGYVDALEKVARAARDTLAQMDRGNPARVALDAALKGLTLHQPFPDDMDEHAETNGDGKAT